MKNKSRNNDSWDKANKIFKFVNIKSHKKIFHTFIAIFGSLIFLGGIITSATISFLIFYNNDKFKDNEIKIQIPDFKYQWNIDALLDVDYSIRLQQFHLLVQNYLQTFLDDNPTINSILNYFGYNSDSTAIVPYTDPDFTHPVIAEDLIWFDKIDIYVQVISKITNKPINWLSSLIPIFELPLDFNSIFYNFFMLFKAYYYNNIETPFMKNAKMNAFYENNEFYFPYTSWPGLTNDNIYQNLIDHWDKFWINEKQEISSDPLTLKSSIPFSFNPVLLTSRPFYVSINNAADVETQLEDLYKWFFNNKTSYIPKDASLYTLPDNTKTYIMWFPPEFGDIYTTIDSLTSESDAVSEADKQITSSIALPIYEKYLSTNPIDPSEVIFNDVIHNIKTSTYSMFIPDDIYKIFEDLSWTNYSKENLNIQIQDDFKEADINKALQTTFAEYIYDKINEILQNSLKSLLPNPTPYNIFGIQRGNIDATNPSSILFWTLPGKRKKLKDNQHFNTYDNWDGLKNEIDNIGSIFFHFKLHIPGAIGTDYPWLGQVLFWNS